ncbi:hypothetical protein RSOLAG22IIIB_10339 [Rhizoctonia solani]|uniref:L-ornithine N(5)-monooxygenase n=1 Tax=Rhizoctonia solani TaxID=456999 RepID=A0A0K6G3A0_9AGAM|nr:hypothetical protein RSOLAG22IIIB_10339 [Rhizoctonia solani]
MIQLLSPLSALGTSSGFPYFSTSLTLRNIGGITAAISLQEKLNMYDYTIFELASDIGGTWRQNTYPGCACDVPAHWYSLSTDPNPDWSHMYAPHDEIHRYWKGVAKRHNIETHIKFNNEFLSAVWDGKEQNYAICFRDVQTHEVFEVKAKIVISAVGTFHYPRWPAVPGRESFQGEILHAQMWNHGISLAGKRVALIGNGCAGSQILPVISEESTTTVTNFCRTPSWYAPRRQKPVPVWVKWVFRNVPFALKGFRLFLATRSEMFYQHLKLGPFASYFRKLAEKDMADYIRNVAPAKYHKYLIPNYDVGCKRIIMDPGYLQALGRSNVDMEWDPILEIVSDGIVTKSGRKHQVDVIAFATGFDIASSVTLDVTGTEGQRLEEYYRQEGGPTGYMGTTIPKFPNWITIYGPNIGTGHASVIFAEELQMNYVSELLKPVLQGKVKSFVPRNEPTRSWNKWVQSCLNSHVWSGCASWYRADGPDAKIFALWPGGNIHMWWSFRKPNWKHFEMVGGENWLLKRRALDSISALLRVGLVVVGIGALTLTELGQSNALAILSQKTLQKGAESVRGLLFYAWGAITIADVYQY